MLGLIPSAPVTFMVSKGHSTEYTYLSEINMLIIEFEDWVE